MQEPLLYISSFHRLNFYRCYERMLHCADNQFISAFEVDLIKTEKLLALSFHPYPWVLVHSWWYNEYYTCLFIEICHWLQMFQDENNIFNENIQLPQWNRNLLCVHTSMNVILMRSLWEFLILYHFHLCWSQSLMKLPSDLAGCNSV